MSKIEKLKEEDFEAAIKAYAKGSRKQIPPMDADEDMIHSMLDFGETYVIKNKKNEINGLLVFIGDENTSGERIIDMAFLYSSKKGNGKKLMEKMVHEAIDANVKMIYSKVSQEDEKTMKFYDKLGFETYGSSKEGDVRVYNLKAAPKTILKNLKEEKNE